MPTNPEMDMTKADREWVTHLAELAVTDPQQFVVTLQNWMIERLAQKNKKQFEAILNAQFTRLKNELDKLLGSDNDRRRS